MKEQMFDTQIWGRGCPAGAPRRAKASGLALGNQVSRQTLLEHQPCAGSCVGLRETGRGKEAAWTALPNLPGHGTKLRGSYHKTDQDVSLERQIRVEVKRC